MANKTFRLEDEDGNVLHPETVSSAVDFSSGVSDFTVGDRRSGSTVGTKSLTVGVRQVASGSGSMAAGTDCYATGAQSFAHGNSAQAIGSRSHAEGANTTASGASSHAEGNATTASGNYSRAEGYDTTASGEASHAEGSNTTASGDYSHAEGYDTTASGESSHAEGIGTTAFSDYSLAVGKFNTAATTTSALTHLFVVGKGSSSTNKSNAIRISSSTCYSNGPWSSTGADYAEYFEWVDGNINDEDRRGLFVTLDGDKIRLATSVDSYILGVISAAPGVVGDSASEEWCDRYVHDVFGAIEYEEYTYTNSKGEEVVGTREKINPDYEPTETYVPREDRKEWSPVGMFGKLVVIDDGTCEVNGFCYPSANGIATASTSGYRVMSRIDSSHIRVLIK